MWRRRERLEERADDEEQDAHAPARNEERKLAAKRVCEEEHEERGRNDFDDAIDTGREQRL